MAFKLTLPVFFAFLTQLAVADDLSAIMAIEKAEGKVSRKLTPYYLKSDFTGDGVQDLAVLIDTKLCIYDIVTRQCFYSDEQFSWAEKWRVIKDRKTFETIVSKDGEITGEREVTLQNDSIVLCKEEVSCRVISIKNKKLMLLHQGC